MVRVVVDLIPLDKLDVEPAQKVAERQRLRPLVGVHRGSQLKGGVHRLPLGARTQRSLCPGKLLVVDVDNGPRHVSRSSMRYQSIKTYQPRARHSGMDGRSRPSVLSLPWPG